ncbi:MAG: nucleotidyltransferase substrate binding protein [Bacteroidetes bacterium]|nr:nucleotidyltransferase substrate binding protein [Bacteroidota bacterium]
MNTLEDIRWKQRFSNYKKALSQLTKAVSLANSRTLSELEQQGLIQSFKYTHELSWNMLRDYLCDQGIQNIHGSKDSVREAFTTGLITNGEIWMDMIRDRNRSSNTYNLETAASIAEHILNRYHSQFLQLEQFFQDLVNVI